MKDPEARLYGATRNSNEYGWKPEDFPLALDDALRQNLACVGGQFQFQLPDATYEMFWLNADSSPRAPYESWADYVVRSVAQVRSTFEKILQTVDFLAEAEAADVLRRKKAAGVNLLDALWFVAYFSHEHEI